MKGIILGLIEGYRRFVSPLLPASCRYIPTCSQYALEAVKRFGARRGFVLAVRRLLRCNPFAQGGYDPVPDEYPTRKKKTYERK